MTIRALPASWPVRFFAVLLVLLAVTPFTQPFSTFGPSSVFEDVSDSKADKAHKDIATVESILSALARDSDRVQPLAALPVPVATPRSSAPLVLRI